MILADRDCHVQQVFGFRADKDFHVIWLSNRFTLGVPDDKSILTFGVPDDKSIFDFGST